MVLLDTKVVASEGNKLEKNQAENGGNVEF